jgi:Ca2+-binding EF-hand superfamily protein
MGRTTGRIIAALIILTLVSVFPLLFGQFKQNISQTVGGAGNSWPGTNCSELLRRIDTDQDGTITQDEWMRFFTERDVNADQRLSPEELQIASGRVFGEEALGPDYGRLAAFEKLDVNKNDKIDPTEWPGTAKDFRYLDSNHDRVISREEFLSNKGRWWNELFENMDFNGDGVISRSEWLDSDQSFDRLDRDHNGAIDRGEFYNPR